MRVIKFKNKLFLSKSCSNTFNINFIKWSSKSYNFVKLDEKWRKKWIENNHHVSYKAETENKKKIYCLSMIPYPSGDLHMGHLRNYTITDIIVRFKRLKKFDILNPMGWDSFGLPAENAAIDNNVHPEKWTSENIKKMKTQMMMMHCDLDWEKEIRTSSENYYKWTQKLFLLLYKHSLVYKKKTEINWDPIDKTVLANEQIDSNGRSWRSGSFVVKKKLSQWFIKISDYAKRLHNDLELLDEWPKNVKEMQRVWLGYANEFEIKFPTNDSRFKYVNVKSKNLEYLFQTQFILVSNCHFIVQEYEKQDSELRNFIKNHYNKSNTLISFFKLKNIYASRPLNSKYELENEFKIPIYVCCNLKIFFGKDSMMGAPGYDLKSFESWIKNTKFDKILVKTNVSSLPNFFESKLNDIYKYLCTEKKSKLSDIFENKSIDEVRHQTSKILKEVGLGNDVDTVKINDWLISRQRYWGTPIPIINCKKCGFVPVPDNQLPVLLPKLDNLDFKKGETLSKLDSFKRTVCPKCKNNATRETDTMDTFMDSSWYFFRFVDPNNTKVPFRFDKANEMMPIDIYVGGVEHAILHLLYCRFISKFLSDINLWNGSMFFGEPIKRLIPQGMVHGKTYTHPQTGKYLKKLDLDDADPKNLRIKGSNLSPKITYEKMSKSKHNGLNPIIYIAEHGADSVRASILFQASVENIIVWNPDQILGTKRWLKKVIDLSELVISTYKLNRKNLFVETTKEYKNIKLNGVCHSVLMLDDHEKKLVSTVNQYIKLVNDSFEKITRFNTVISNLMKLTNYLNEILNSNKIYNRDLVLDSYVKLIILMSPVTPCTSEECWEKISIFLKHNTTSIFLNYFPIPLILEKI